MADETGTIVQDGDLVSDLADLIHEVLGDECPDIIPDGLVGCWDSAVAVVAHLRAHHLLR